MTSYAKISQFAHCVPAHIVTNDDLSQMLDTSDEWIRSRTGILERRISTTETTSQLAIRVAQQLLETSQIPAERLEFILVATVSPDSSMPSTAALVQGAIGASIAIAFDIAAACSGFTFALSTAEKLIASGAYKCGLVIGAETMSKLLDWSDRSSAVLFGDGAGGVLLEASTSPHFLAEDLGTDGSQAGCLIAGQVPLSSPFSEKIASSSSLIMDGRRVFDFATRRIPQSILSCVERAGIDLTSIDYFFLHQANSRILDKIARKLGLPIEKFPANLMHYGNTSAASIPILLSECVADGRLRCDGSQTILLSGFGGGLTWGTIIVKI